MHSATAAIAPSKAEWGAVQAQELSHFHPGAQVDRESHQLPPDESLELLPFAVFGDLFLLVILVCLMQVSSGLRAFWACSLFMEFSQ